MIKLNTNIKKSVPIMSLIKYRSSILSSQLLNNCLVSTLDKFAPMKM